MADEIKTKKMLPVLIGNGEHVMGKASITQTPHSVTIVITASGPEARRLGDYVAADELVALSFSGIPVRPHRPLEGETS